LSTTTEAGDFGAPGQGGGTRASSEGEGRRGGLHASATSGDSHGGSHTHGDGHGVDGHLHGAGGHGGGGHGHGGDGHDGDHGHVEGAFAHLTLRGYATGFFAAVFLTAIPFWIVMGKAFGSSGTTAAVILGFAAVQIVVHMVYFLHMNAKSEGGWNLLALMFTVMLVVIALSGSMWVMYHLNNNMMPASMMNMHTMP
jgi:cytochrome o ubiquinol oxidase subunit IV